MLYSWLKFAAFCAADIRKHKELIEEYDRKTGQYVITIVEKRAGKFSFRITSFLHDQLVLGYTYEKSEVIELWDKVFYVLDIVHLRYTHTFAAKGFALVEE